MGRDAKLARLTLGAGVAARRGHNAFTIGKFRAPLSGGQIGGRSLQGGH